MSTNFSNSLCVVRSVCGPFSRIRVHTPRVQYGHTTSFMHDIVLPRDISQESWLSWGGVIEFKVKCSSHLEHIVDSYFLIYRPFRADVFLTCMIRMICMIYLMLSGGSCVICMVDDMFPRSDLYCTDPAQHLILPGGSCAICTI